MSFLRLDLAYPIRDKLSNLFHSNLEVCIDFSSFVLPSSFNLFVSATQLHFLKVGVIAKYKLTVSF